MDKKVSILIVTHDHEKYIAQAVASALQQEVNFEYEIVIGEDCSTDHTREILKELNRDHPEHIRLLLRENKGTGLPGKSNFVETLKACQGQYIALLDGDDYWTDVRKLQSQVDFMEGHPEYALCFHNARIVRGDADPDPETFCSPNQKETSTLEDLLAGNFIFTGSTMFRRGLFGELPEWFYVTQTGDWALHALNAQYGKIGYLNKVMATYRVHARGFWSSGDPAPQIIEGIAMLDNINAYLGFQYDKQIKAAQHKFYAELAEMAYQKGDFINSKTFLVKCLQLGISNYRLPTALQLGRLFKLQSPTFNNLLRSWRNFISHRKLLV